MIFKTITTMLRSIDQRIALQNELTAELIKAVKDNTKASKEPATLGVRVKTPNRPKFVYTATCIEDGSHESTFKQQDLALRIGCSRGGSFSEHIKTGEPIKSKNGKTYILGKEEYNNPTIKI